MLPRKIVFTCFLFLIIFLGCYLFGCGSTINVTPSSTPYFRAFISSDGGITFSSGSSVSVTNFPALLAVDPSALLLANGKTRLYYFGSFTREGDPVMNQPGGINKFYCAISDDGLIFSEEAMVISNEGISSEHISDPFVLNISNGAYVMYISSGTNILSARSNNGINFTWDAGYRGTLGGVPGALLLTNNLIRLYYLSSNGIKSMISTEEAGLHFVTEEGYRISPPSGTYTFAGDPNPISIGNNTYLMCFKQTLSGQSSPSGDRIFVAQSTDEGFNWSLISSEPIALGSVPTIVKDSSGRIIIYIPFQAQ